MISNSSNENGKPVVESLNSTPVIIVSQNDDDTYKDNSDVYHVDSNFCITEKFYETNTDTLAERYDDGIEVLNNALLNEKSTSITQIHILDTISATSPATPLEDNLVNTYIPKPDKGAERNSTILEPIVEVGETVENTGNAVIEEVLYPNPLVDIGNANDDSENGTSLDNTNLSHEKEALITKINTIEEDAKRDLFCKTEDIPKNKRKGKMSQLLHEKIYFGLYQKKTGFLTDRPLVWANVLENIYRIPG